jgi:hypothetical protein
METIPRRLFRIKPGVRPYGGRLIEAVTVTETSVEGWVRLSAQRYATAKRTYGIDEVSEAPLPAQETEPTPTP